MARRKGAVEPTEEEQDGDGGDDGGRGDIASSHSTSKISGRDRVVV